MFRLEVSHLQALIILLPDALPTVVEYVLAKVSRKVYNYKVFLTDCV